MNYLHQYYLKNTPENKVKYIDPLIAGLPKEPVTLEELNNTVDKIMALVDKLKRGKYYGRNRNAICTA